MSAGRPVYIVDNDAISRRHLVSVLRRHEYRPTALVEGKGLLEALGFLSFVIVILEQRLPHISGLAVFEEIRHVRLDILSIATNACADSLKGDVR
jgi:DNA-binding NtrC family response regulator